MKKYLNRNIGVAIAWLAIVSILPFDSMCCVAGSGASDGWTPPMPDNYWPSAERPIILKNDELLFCGDTGTARGRMEWKTSPNFLAISPGGKLVVAIVFRDGTLMADILDQRRQVIKSVSLTKENLATKAWIGDDGQMLVGLGPPAKEMEEIVQRSVVSGKPVDIEIEWEWVYYGRDAKPMPIKFTGNVGEISMLDDGRWVSFIYNSTAQAYILSMWQKDQIEWSKELGGKGMDTSGIFMSVTRKGPIRIGVHIPKGVGTFEYDIKGHEISAESQPQKDKQ